MAKEIAGLQLHFTQQIINVQWEGGLAVEFGDKDQDAPKPPTATPAISRRRSVQLA